MTPREFRQEQDFSFDHFIELTGTGIKPNYVNIELFAHEYHKSKLKLLGIADVVGRSEQLSCEHDYQPDITCGVDITCCTKCGDVI